jgi:pimeloyl-ACP methyl ester carboxylesterase
VLAQLPAHPLTQLHTLAGLGHLAHEEQPRLVAEIVQGLAQAADLPLPAAATA